MLPLARLAVFFLVLASCAPQMLGAPTAPPTTSDPAVVKLVISDAEGEAGHCTAWKVGTSLIATAGHCCEEGYTYSTKGSHAVEGSAPTILVDDDEHDVCILRGAISGKVISLASSDPDVGEVVWTLGYPRGTFLISDGYWSGRNEDGKGVCSVVVNPGASGSPILNTDNEAVGVLIEYRQGMDNLAYIANLDWLRAAVASANRK